MRVKRILAVTLAAAVFPATAAATPKTPDGLPPGWSIAGDAASSNQGFEFGRCQTRKHVEGPWVCVPDELATAARKKVKARASGYQSYSMNRVAKPFYGIGQLVVGQIRWEINGFLTGYEAKWKTSNNVEDGFGPPVRYRFYTTKWRLTSSGQSWVNDQTIPSSTGFTPGTATEGVVSTPWWYTFQGSGGFDFRNSFHFTIRAAGGDYFSPWYDSRIYHCGSSDCHFVL